MSVTKEQVEQALLDGIHKAVISGQTKEARELMAAYGVSEKLKNEAEAEADKYSVDCTKLEQTEEELKAQKAQFEAQQTEAKEKLDIQREQLEVQREQLEVQREQIALDKKKSEEQIAMQKEQLEAQREVDKQRAVAQKTSAVAGAVFGFIGTVVGAAATIAVCILSGKSQQETENQKIRYGLEFQKRHFQAQKEDDLVTKYSDESFRPR